MKALFIFDTVLQIDEKNNYWGQTLTYDFFKQRYLPMFDEMIISTRVKNKDKSNNKGYKITNGKNITVRPIRNYKDIPDAIKNRKKIIDEVDGVVKDVDCLIVRMPSILGMFAIQGANKYQKKVVVEMVACAWDGYMNHARLGGKILAPIMFLLTKKYIRKSPYVIYVTDEFLQKRYPNKHHNIGCSDVVIENIDEDYISNKSEYLKHVDCKKLKIVTVASVQLKYKGQEYVMKAISKLKKYGYNIHYFLIGGGDNTRLKKFAKKYNVEENVVFMGSFPHDEIFNLLSEMDLYIQPSLQEGLPRAMIEAMSVGMPIIGSNAGGIPELIDKNCIFKKKNVNEIMSIIKKIDNEFLVNQSQKNYLNSKKFDKNSLNNKRNEFYKEGLDL